MYAVLSTFDRYVCEEPVRRSISEALLPISKKMQHIVLAHLLYTYQTSEGFQPEIEYADGYAPDKASASDDFCFMHKLIGEIMSDEDGEAIQPSFETPAFLTARSWRVLSERDSGPYQSIFKFHRMSHRVSHRVFLRMSHRTPHRTPHRASNRPYHRMLHRMFHRMFCRTDLTLRIQERPQHPLHQQSI